MEKIETTIFVDWENLLTDLRAIQKNPKTDKRFKEPDFSFNNSEQLLSLIRSFLEPEEELKRIYFYASEPFTEVEPRIKGNKNKELEEYKDKNPKDYEKRVNKSGIIQAFNHEITLMRCWRTILPSYIAPNKEGVFCCLARIPILCLC